MPKRYNQDMFRATTLPKNIRIWLVFSPILFGTIFESAAAGQPQVAANGVLNAASSALVGWPNSSIAQGSMFSIYGSNLGPPSSPATSYPLQMTLGGVSVQVTSESGTLNAIPIFVAPNVVNAILPGNTPAGEASLTVTFGGQISDAVPFQVAVNSFGVFSVNSNGLGVGVITGTNYELYPVSSPAKPGDTAVIWGTGLGASPGDTGFAPPQQIDMPNLPLLVYVGTQAATVSYRGRAAFTGEDQINFVIPAGITGCYVPVAVQIGNIVSNFVTMPIASTGQSCPDPTPPVPPLGSGPTDGIPPPTGNITLLRDTFIGTTTVTTDYGIAFFGDPQTEAFPYVPPVFGNPYSLPVGTCIGGVTFPAFIDVLVSELPAGPISISGPNGTTQLTEAPNSGSYASEIGGGSGASAQPLFISAGAYTISAPGGVFVAPALPGPGLGPFSQNITVPQPLIWTNQGDISTVNRSAGLDVTWTGGDPNGTVQITADVGFICNVRTSDQHFMIPAFVLLSYPATGTLAGLLELGTVSTTPFTASGISSGTMNSEVLIRKNVTYQ
jgi:uncharacterized protein (TIGR03437 family)